MSLGPQSRRAIGCAGGWVGTGRFLEGSLPWRPGWPQKPSRWPRTLSDAGPTSALRGSFARNRGPARVRSHNLKTSSGSTAPDIALPSFHVSTNDNQKCHSRETEIGRVFQSCLRGTAFFGSICQ